MCYSINENRVNCIKKMFNPIKDFLKKNVFILYLCIVMILLYYILLLGTHYIKYTIS